MSELFKVFGSKLELPAAETGWKFTRRPGGWCIAERAGPDGAVERVRLFVHESRGRLSANLGGRLFTGEVHSTRAGHGGAAGHDSDLVAQFPGKVRKILVQEGASVEAGDPLVLVEAMKMEFSVKAPVSGTVAKILVKEGQQLSPGDRFAEITASASAAESTSVSASANRQRGPIHGA